MTKTTRELLIEGGWAVGREPVPGAPTVDELDDAYRVAWASQAQAHGSYLAVPPKVVARLQEEHRVAHLARLGLDANHRALAAEEPEPFVAPPRGAECAWGPCGEAPRPDSPYCSGIHHSMHAAGPRASGEKRAARPGAKGGGLRSGTECVNGHDLRGTTPDGKAVLAFPKSGGRPVCRLCKRDAAARHAEKVAAKGKI